MLSDKLANTLHATERIDCVSVDIHEDGFPAVVVPERVLHLVSNEVDDKQLLAPTKVIDKGASWCMINVNPTKPV